ncbi:hypothetical protein GF357_05090 [Candidatus Dojkabacteria bacterium]|nr:hypothetical protein [Candidatus Dojkabacteria bacterium]
MATDKITLEQLPGYTDLDEYGNYTESDVQSFELAAQVIFQHNENKDIPDNTENINVQIKFSADIIDTTRYRVIYKGRRYQIDQVRRSAVIQPSALKLQCSLIRE